jgi:hypothetical protein
VSALTAAWQAALAAEQRAVFGYSLLGPWLTGGDEQYAVSFSNLHETLRDRTAAALAAAGHTPHPPAVDYPALYPVADPAAARALAIRLEDGCAEAWRYLYLQAASVHHDRHAARRLRALAQQALTASAIRAARWRAVVTPGQAAQPFPGA